MSVDNREFYHVSLKLFIKNSEGKTLVLKAIDNGTFAGYHDFPGGRIDKDEFKTPMIDILQREVLEEVGDVEVSINPVPVAVGRHLILSKFTATKEKDIPVLYLFFEASYIKGDPTISNEHSGIEWVDLESIDLERYFTSGILEAVKMYLKK